MKKCQKILYENFHFLVVKFSFYLNRLVFVMHVHVEPTQVAYAIFFFFVITVFA